MGQNDEGLYWYYQNLSFKDKKTLKYTVTESVEGLGILGKIIMDPDITEVMINGYDTIFVEKSGKLMQLEEHFESSEDLERIVKRFVSSMDRTVDASNPIVDARLDDGSRVHVVLPPVALNGATVTIRRFSKNPMTIEKLLSYGSITPEAADFLEKVVATRHNVFVCGGTGSGKTTFLNALSNYIQPWERVITIEDSAELQIKNIPNLVRMETKKANSKDSNEITIRDLIKASLRMRPDRIIVGEVRGPEALDMLQAMNTGHDGSLSTGHANSPEGMLSRLETMVLTGSAELPLEAIRQQIASAVDYIVHLSRLRDFSRKCMEITEVTGYKDGRVTLNSIYKFKEDEKSTLKKVSGRLVRTENKIQDEKNKVRLKYYECNMTKGQHMLAYLFFSVMIGVVLFIYYRFIPVAVIGGFIIGIWQEKNYSQTVTKRRQEKLRLQFKEFLEIISISISGGSGRSMENAVEDSLRELQMIYNQDSDIVREIALIVSDYRHAGIPMVKGFEELGERSDIDDVLSFAAIYKTIEGKTSDFGYIIAQTRDIIKDKVEIAMEIQTEINSAKSEAYMMLVLPLVLVIMMSTMGSGFMDSLFTTAIGRIAATVGVVCTFVSYVIATRAAEIDV